MSSWVTPFDDDPQIHGPQRLCPVQGLDLRLFVDPEHHRLVWWLQLQVDDVSDVLNAKTVQSKA
jgi:hypothetical protein